MSKLSNKPWGDIDKDDLLKYVINNPKKAKDIYLKIEPNWEVDPSSRLSYPIADKNGTIYRYALSSALTYAKANNETEVINKLKKLYKQYNLEEEFNMNKAAVHSIDKRKDNRKVVEAYVFKGNYTPSGDAEIFLVDYLKKNLKGFKLEGFHFIGKYWSFSLLSNSIRTAEFAKNYGSGLGKGFSLGEIDYLNNAPKVVNKEFKAYADKVRSDLNRAEDELDYLTKVLKDAEKGLKNSGIASGLIGWV